MLFLVANLIACSDNSGKDNESSLIDDSDIVETFAPLPQTSEYTIDHQGLERSYWLHIPETVGVSAPLVIVMHGFTGSAGSTMEWTEMNSVADTEGFVVVYPQGIEDDWGSTFFNVGYEFHGDQTVDDVDFIRTLVSELQQSYGLSQTDVFATGMSNGGDMSYLLACEASDLVKAIAPVAGTMMTHIYESCRPTELVPVFEIHGTVDDVTLWDGDPNNEGGWGAYMDIPNIINFWAEHNNVQLSETVELENNAQNDGSTVIFERYGASSDPAQVWLYRVENGGHDWPGVWGNMDVNASESVWQFFNEYR